MGLSRSRRSVPPSDAFEEHRLPGYLGVAALAADGTVRYVTAELARRLRWEPEQWVGRNGFEFIDDNDVDQAAVSFAGTVDRSGFHQPLTFRVRGGDGSSREVVVVAENLLDDERVGAIVLSVTDSDEYGRAESLALHQAEVLELIARDRPLPDTLRAVVELVESQVPATRCAMLLAVDRDHFEVAAAPSFGPELRHVLEGIETDDPGSLVARSWTHAEALVAAELPTPELATSSQVGRQIGAAACWAAPIASSRDEQGIGVCAVYHADPVHPRPEEWSLVRLAARLAALAFEHEARRIELQRQAMFDPKTGLANRHTITNTLAAALARDVDGAALFIDIDRLKVVNDSLGHAVGDELIAAIAERLRRFEHTDIKVGRFGGDEFLVLLEHHTPATARAVAERLLTEIRQPLHLGHRHFTVTSSIGIAFYGRQRCADDILRDADLAMYAAKAAGRNTIRVCDERLRGRAVEQHQLEAALRTAVANDEIAVHYQPVLDLHSGRPSSMEALARWHGPDGWIAPDRFIAVAEDSGLVIPLGEKILTQACAAARTLEHSLAGLRVAANVSVIQLRAGNLSHTVETSLDQTGLAPQRLTLEITEAVLLDDDRDVTAELERIRHLGVSIAIDDFGTGYSSLAYLRQLPADELKIDRAFVTDLDNPDGRVIVEAIATVAHQLGLHTIAEGVETRTQLHTLRDIGIDAVQGYLISQPRPLPDLRPTLTALAHPAHAPTHPLPTS